MDQNLEQKVFPWIIKFLEIMGKIYLISFIAVQFAWIILITMLPIRFSSDDSTVLIVCFDDAQN